MPHQPVRWEPDRQLDAARPRRAQHAEAAKEAAVLQLINAYRVRGHLIADLDPLGVGAELSSGARSGDVRADHLGPRPRVPHRVARRSDRRERAAAGRDAARDSRDAAPDLLRQGRLRVHEHPASGAEALAAAAHGAGRAITWPLDTRTRMRDSGAPDRGRRSSSTFCTPASSARSDSRSKAPRRRSRFSTN